MYITLPRPIIKCSQCGSTDIAVPERNANGPADDDDGTVLLRCRKCGHERVSGHKQRFDDMMEASVGTWTPPTEETF